MQQRTITKGDVMARVIPIQELLVMSPEDAKNYKDQQRLSICLRYVKGRDQVEEGHLNLLRQADGNLIHVYYPVFMWSHGVRDYTIRWDGGRFRMSSHDVKLGKTLETQIASLIYLASYHSNCLFC
jgi:hypothetical protein